MAQKYFAALGGWMQCVVEYGACILLLVMNSKLYKCILVATNANCTQAYCTEEFKAQGGMPLP